MFAHLQTGVGTSTTSSAYFGPFKETDEADSFVEHVRNEYGKLGTASPMTISLINELPEGRGLLDPGSLRGFMKV
jgi:hypothetical protein